jgi:hypothetical protein
MIPATTRNTGYAAKKVTKKVIKTAERELVSFDFAVKYLLRGKSDYVILSGFLSPR